MGEGLPTEPSSSHFADCPDNFSNSMKQASSIEMQPALNRLEAFYTIRGTLASAARLGAGGRGKFITTATHFCSPAPLLNYRRRRGK